MKPHSMCDNKANSATERRGMTMLEILVALTVIAILAAILIPAVSSVRESSRRMTCQERLRSLGIALQAFEASRRQFPSCSGPMIPQSRTVAEPFSPHRQLLEFIDQTPLSVDLRKMGMQASSFASRDELPASLRSPLPAFSCPSDPIEFGTNYCVSFGADVRMRAPNDDTGGSFSALGGRRASHYHDGLSHVVAMSERKKSSLAVETFGIPDFWHSGLCAITPDYSAEELEQVCESLTGPPSAFDPHVGWYWHLAGFGQTWFNHLRNPNSQAIQCSSDATSPNSPRSTYSSSASAVVQAGSYHSGGVNTLMMDGAVRFVSDSVDNDVWRKLGGIVDGGSPN